MHSTCSLSLSLTRAHILQDICRDPKFYTGGASRFDVSQGILGDCWLVAAIASLTQDRILLSKVCCCVLVVCVCVREKECVCERERVCD